MLSRAKIKKIVEENRPYLEALEEFDKTGKLSKVIHKERVNFTIDENLIKRFRQYCEKNNIKMSNVIEKLITQELEQKPL